MTKAINSRQKLIKIFVMMFSITGLLIFIVKMISYPRYLSDFFMVFKELTFSLNVAAAIWLVLAIIYTIMYIKNRKSLCTIFSILFTLPLYIAAAYYLNRVVFYEYFEGRVLIGNIKVRLAFVTPKIIVFNLLLIAASIFLSVFLFRFFLRSVAKLRESDDSKKNNKGVRAYLPLFIGIALIIIFNSGVLLCRHLILSSPDSRNATSIDRNNSVYVIGLDGAEWRIIDRLIAEGKLPGFKKMIENGARGNLLAPPAYVLSGPSWTSIATGLTVSGHGVRGNKGSVSRPRLWNIIDYYGMSSIVVNWLCSPYPEEIKGAFISGPYDKLVSYPSFVLNEIEEKVGDYCADVDSREISDEFLESCFSVAETRARAVRYLLETRKPNLLAVIFTSSDRIQHFFWQYMEPEKFDFKMNESELEKYRDSIEKHYMKMDEIISRIVQSADSSRTTFIVVSDHGFEAIQQKNVVTSDIELNYLLNKIGLFNLDREMNVDRSATLAEEVTEFGKTRRRIKISDKSIIKDLVSFIESLRLVEDNAVLFEDVGSTDDEIMLTVNSRVYPLYNTTVSGIYKGFKYSFPLEQLIHRNKLRTGDHRREGILILSGNKIKSGVELGDVKVYDVTPTILALFEMPLAFDMDGIPVVDAFSDDFRGKWVRRYICSYNTIKKDYIEVAPLQDGSLEKLKSLGYLN